MTRPQSRSFRNRLLLSFLIASLAPMIISVSYTHLTLPTMSCV